MSTRSVNLSELARDIMRELAAAAPARVVEVEIADDIVVQGDAGMLRIALKNLLSNAWKFTGKTKSPRIEFGAVVGTEGTREFFVRDNGAGFDMQSAKKLFQPFHRFHTSADFPGSGVGLSTVQRVLHRHGGRIRVEAAVDQGATFYFALGI
jgi:signal transduction histidine kinase